VDDDAAAVADVQTSGAREVVVGAHANRGDDDVRGDGAARGGFHVGCGDVVDLLVGEDVHPVGLEVFLHDLHHLGVERGHDLRAGLDDGGRDSAVGEVLRDLEADEPATDDHGGLRGDVQGSGDGVGVIDIAQRVEGSGDGVGVLDIAQRIGAVDARDRRYEGRRAGGEDEVVVAQ